METKQLVTVIQIGKDEKKLSVKFKWELDSPMDDGMYLPNVKFYEMRKVGDYAGARVRILKGFWVGGGQGRSHDELTEVDEGYLSISQKLIVFAGRSRTISIPLEKIIRVEPYSDGIGIYKEGREKEYRFAWGKSIDMKFISAEGVEGNAKPLSGSIVDLWISLQKYRKPVV
jgi:hypothetical protein